MVCGLLAGMAKATSLGVARGLWCAVCAGVYWFIRWGISIWLSWPVSVVVVNMIGFCGVCQVAMISGVVLGASLRLALVMRSKYSGFSPVGSCGVVAGLARSNSCWLFGNSAGIVWPL